MAIPEDIPVQESWTVIAWNCLLSFWACCPLERSSAWERATGAAATLIEANWEKAMATIAIAVAVVGFVKYIVMSTRLNLNENEMKFACKKL